MRFLSKKFCTFSSGMFSKGLQKLKQAKNLKPDATQTMVLSSYVGNAFIIASGASGGSPLRSLGAGSGVLTGLFGIAGGKRQIFSIPGSRLVLHGQQLASLFYIASGFDVGGFVGEQRLSEVAMGGFILGGSTANLIGRPKLGATLFMITTSTHLAQVIESGLRSGNPDWMMLGAAAAFAITNIASAFVTHDHAPEVDIEQKAQAEKEVHRECDDESGNSPSLS